MPLPSHHPNRGIRRPLRTLSLAISTAAKSSTFSCHSRRESARCHSQRESASCHSRRESARCHSQRESASCHSRRESASCHSQRESASCHSRRESAFRFKPASPTKPRGETPAVQPPHTSPTPNPVISTEAAHTVSCAAERPPHFAFAFAVALAVAIAIAVAVAFPVAVAVAIAVADAFAGCPIHAVSSHEWAIARRRDPLLPHLPATPGLQAWLRPSPAQRNVISTETSALPAPNPVISTEAAHTVSCAAERPPHFAFAVAFAVALAVAVAVAVAFAVAFAVPITFAFASRYPKASALGLSTTPTTRGFSPWGMPSYHPQRCRENPSQEAA
jgi:hypothetical protein